MRLPPPSPRLRGAESLILPLHKTLLADAETASDSEVPGLLFLGAALGDLLAEEQPDDEDGLRSLFDRAPGDLVRQDFWEGWVELGVRHSLGSGSDGSARQSKELVVGRGGWQSGRHHAHEENGVSLGNVNDVGR